MSTKSSPVPKPRRRRRAALALKAAAKKTSWTEEQQLDFLSHFTVEQKALQGIKVDQSKLTQSSQWFAGLVGWGLATPISILCQGIDDDNNNDAFEDFLDREVKLYLEDMEAHGQPVSPAEPEPEPIPESTELDQHLVVPAERFDKAMLVLSSADPLPGVDMGERLMRWVFDFPGNLTAYIDICNGEPPYLDAYLVRTVNDFREVVCTLAIVATLEQTLTFKYDKAVYRVTFHRG